MSEAIAFSHVPLRNHLRFEAAASRPTRSVSAPLLLSRCAADATLDGSIAGESSCACWSVTPRPCLTIASNSLTPWRYGNPQEIPLPAAGELPIR